MASEETMTIHSSSSSIMQEDFLYDIDIGNDGYGHDHDHDHQTHHPHNLSRLSTCTSNRVYGYNGDDMSMYMSRLSIESSEGDGDADADDEEFSDDNKERGKEVISGLSSDSDKEPASACYSLPVTPVRRRSRVGLVNQQMKEYASENEVQKGLLRQKAERKVNLKRRRIIRERRWVEKKRDGDGEVDEEEEEEEEEEDFMEVGNSLSTGDSEGGGGGGGGGLMVITRPKGGGRSLCMDLDEVKACKDLGFELEHERMFEMPTRLTMSASLDTTSSGGNSPIATWRISSPGDDPRDVKARLKVWAQAVALASTSRPGSL